MAVLLVAADADHALGVWHNLAIVVWRCETKPEAVSAMRQEYLSVASRYPGGIGMLTIIEDTATMPPIEARKAIADLFEELGPRVKVSAAVFEGSGFRAAFVRGVVTGLNMMTSQPFPHRVYGELTAAAEWLAQGLPQADGRRATVAQLIDAVGKLRARHADGAFVLQDSPIEVETGEHPSGHGGPGRLF